MGLSKLQLQRMIREAAEAVSPKPKTSIDKTITVLVEAAHPATELPLDHELHSYRDGLIDQYIQEMLKQTGEVPDVSDLYDMDLLDLDMLVSNIDPEALHDPDMIAIDSEDDPDAWYDDMRSGGRLNDVHESTDQDVPLQGDGDEWDTDNIAVTEGMRNRLRSEVRALEMSVDGLSDEVMGLTPDTLYELYGAVEGIVITGGRMADILAEYENLGLTPPPGVQEARRIVTTDHGRHVPIYRGERAMTKKAALKLLAALFGVESGGASDETLLRALPDALRTSDKTNICRFGKVEINRDFEIPGPSWIRSGGSGPAVLQRNAQRAVSAVAPGQKGTSRPVDVLWASGWSTSKAAAGTKYVHQDHIKGTNYDVLVVAELPFWAVPAEALNSAKSFFLTKDMQSVRIKSVTVAQHLVDHQFEARRRKKKTKAKSKKRSQLTHVVMPTVWGYGSSGFGDGSGDSGGCGMGESYDALQEQHERLLNEAVCPYCGDANAYIGGGPKNIECPNNSCVCFTQRQFDDVHKTGHRTLASMVQNPVLIHPAVPAHSGQMFASVIKYVGSELGDDHGGVTLVDAYFDAPDTGFGSDRWFEYCTLMHDKADMISFVLVAQNDYGSSHVVMGDKTMTIKEFLKIANSIMP